MLQPKDKGAEWSVVIPYFNEEDYLEATLRSLGDQTLRGFTLILVDNASTDRSAEIAAKCALSMPDTHVMLLSETEPGQAAALKTGIAAVESPFVAICDADTFYPPAYLETADRLYRESGDTIVAAYAFGAPASGFKHWFARAKGVTVASLLAKQCHAGGYAQTYRTKALRQSGGYDRALWPYCLKDHELAHRVSKHGAVRYAFDFWCVANDRRGDRKNVTWTLAERLLYHVTPFARKDWFFYKFLRPRFEARGLSELKLRDRSWEETPSS